VAIKIIAFFLITIHIEASGVGGSCGKWLIFKGQGPPRSRAVL